MKQIIVEIPEDALRMFDWDEARFAREMYEAAVVQWFGEALLSQGQASEMLGISRGEFFDVLYKHKASPINLTPEELAGEFREIKSEKR